MCFLAAVAFGLTGDYTSQNSCLPPHRLNTPHCSAPALEICAFSSGGHQAQALYFRQNRCQIKITQPSSPFQVTLHPIAPRPAEMLPPTPAAPLRYVGLISHQPLLGSHVSLDISARTGNFVPRRRSRGRKMLRSLPVPAHVPRGSHQPLSQRRTEAEWRTEAGGQPA